MRSRWTSERYTSGVQVIEETALSIWIGQSVKHQHKTTRSVHLESTCQMHKEHHSVDFHIVSVFLMWRDKCEYIFRARIRKYCRRFGDADHVFINVSLLAKSLMLGLQKIADFWPSNRVRENAELLSKMIVERLSRLMILLKLVCIY